MPVIEHWCWDDEDTARPPYIHVYSDDGCLACLHYASPAERELHIAFVQRAVALHAEVERLRAYVRKVIDTDERIPANAGIRRGVALRVLADVACDLLNTDAR